MKPFFAIIAFLLFYCSYSQTKNYNTTITEAKNVEIKDGVVNIKKADTVIVKIFISEKKNFLILDSLIQSYDTSTRKFTTRYYVRNHTGLSHDIDVQFKFTYPLTSFKVSSNGSGTTQMSTMKGGGNTMWVAVGKVVSQKGALIIAESGAPIKAEVRGIDGAFKRN